VSSASAASANLISAKILTDASLCACRSVREFCWGSHSPLALIRLSSLTRPVAAAKTVGRLGIGDQAPDGTFRTVRQYELQHDDTSLTTPPRPSPIPNP
jgi:hypothetical protein